MPHHQHLGAAHNHLHAMEARAPQFGGGPVSWVFFTENPQPTQQAGHGGHQHQQEQQQQQQQSQGSSGSSPSSSDSGNTGGAQQQASSPSGSFMGVTGPPVQGVAGPPVQGQAQAQSQPQVQPQGQSQGQFQAQPQAQSQGQVQAQAPQPTVNSGASASSGGQQQAQPQQEASNPFDAFQSFRNSQASAAAASPTGSQGKEPGAKPTGQGSSGPTASSFNDQPVETPFGTSPSGVAAGAASPSSSSGTSSDSSSGGMSGGAKAGIAFGIIILVALVAGLAYFCFRRKKAQKHAHQKLQDEKSNLHNQQSSITSHVSVRKSKTDAPRLSLRPVTEMFPDEKQEMSTNGMANRRPQLPNTPSSGDLSNPFGDHAAAPRELDAFNGPNSTENAAAGLVAPAPAKLKDDRSSPEDREGAASPAMSNRGAPGAPGNNVHRVQLDFKPSMEDELELRAGQVVRMLHEYDDGWALCIRLDRSQQGVVPRSCLSKLPIKPRPNGPPPAGMRGPPQGGRPRGPGQGPPRPMSPAGAMSPQPGDPRMRAPPPAGRNRSQSNTAYGGQPRPMSPGPNGPYRGGPPSGRPRSNSATNASRRITPPNTSPNPNSTSPTQGPGVPSRKPVPGQAV